MRDISKMIGEPASSKPCFCRACVEGKATRHQLGKRDPSRAPLYPAPRPGFIMHADMFTLRYPTKGGKKYGLLFIDGYSKFVHIFLLRLKSEFLPIFQRFVAMLEARFGKEKPLAQFLADGDGAYTSIALDAFCISKGIQQLLSPPYTQSLNGLSEGNVRILVTMARCMLIHAGTPAQYTGEAIMYAAYILNRLPSRPTAGSTRLEKWMGRKLPRAHHSIRTFGCAVWWTIYHPDGKTGP
jgi:hypothetical protein